MEIVNKVITKVDGYKTYIGLVITFVAGGLNFVNVLDDESAKALASFGAVVMGFGFRSAIKKLEK